MSPTHSRARPPRKDAPAEYREVVAFARSLFEASPIELHPLFAALEQGRLNPDEVRRIAIEIHHVVDHFPRLLAALLSSLPHWTLRMTLTENLFEEHGRMQPARVHVETYRAFLVGLGVDPEALAVARPSIPVIAYNRAVLDLCLHHPCAEGLGALGVIEEIVARASPLVARFCRSHSEGSNPSFGHFSDHQELDPTHAEELYEIAARVAAAEGLGRVRQGMELGFYYHMRLYTDLLAVVRGAGGAVA